MGAAPPGQAATVPTSIGCGTIAGDGFVSIQGTARHLSANFIPETDRADPRPEIGPKNDAVRELAFAPVHGRPWRGLRRGYRRCCRAANTPGIGSIEVLCQSDQPQRDKDAGTHAAQVLVWNGIVSVHPLPHFLSTLWKVKSMEPHRAHHIPFNPSHGFTPWVWERRVKSYLTVIEHLGRWLRQAEWNDRAQPGTTPYLWADHDYRAEFDHLRLSKSLVEVADQNASDGRVLVDRHNCSRWFRVTNHEESA